MNQRIKHDNLATNLNKDKKEILENVMDTETYKVAKELLQKYDPHRFLVEKEEQQPEEALPRIPVLSEEQTLRRRKVPSNSLNLASNASVKSPHQAVNGHPIAPVRNQKSGALANGTASTSLPPVMVNGGFVRAPVPPVPILPGERGIFDKMFDLVIRDGPSDRIALICKQCYGHNGMTLVEEHNFISYRCCYCGFFNQAKMKQLNTAKPDEQREEISRCADSVNSTDVESSNKSEEEEEEMPILLDGKEKSENTADEKKDEEIETEFQVNSKESVPIEN